MHVTTYLRPNAQGTYQWSWNIAADDRNHTTDLGGLAIIESGHEGYRTRKAALEAGKTRLDELQRVAY